MSVFRPFKQSAITTNSMTNSFSGTMENTPSTMSLKSDAGTRESSRPSSPSAASCDDSISHDPQTVLPRPKDNLDELQAERERLFSVNGLAKDNMETPCTRLKKDIEQMNLWTAYVKRNRIWSEIPPQCYAAAKYFSVTQMPAREMLETMKNGISLNESVTDKISLLVGETFNTHERNIRQWFVEKRMLDDITSDMPESGLSCNI
jgi:hypothetical protein